MSNHTPGPWTACNNDGYSIWRITSSERTIAEVVGDSAETEMNAHLIAAAPEMLELLAELVMKASAAEEFWKLLRSNDELIANLGSTIAKAAQLIVKIEGGEE